MSLASVYNTPVKYKGATKAVYISGFWANVRGIDVKLYRPKFVRVCCKFELDDVMYFLALPETSDLLVTARPLS